MATMNSTSITVGDHYTLELNRTEDDEPYLVLYYRQNFSDGDAEEGSMAFLSDEAQALRDALTQLLARVPETTTG